MHSAWICNPCFARWKERVKGNDCPEALLSPVQNRKPFRNRLNRNLSISARASPKQIEHVYVFCCRPEVDDDVISGQDLKTAGGYISENFEVASTSIFLDISQKSFRDYGGRGYRQ